MSVNLGVFLKMSVVFTTVLFNVACQPDYLNLPPYNAQGQLQMVVEIPAGSRAKFELNKQSGRLEQDIKDGTPRFIDYLPYPVHYGFVPGTLLTIKEGGDGDPLDVMLLDGTVERGDIVPIRLLGVMYLLDGGQNDHKLIAVSVDGVFAEVRDLQDLMSNFPGVTEIVSTFFVGYKGPGVMVFNGFGDRDAATGLLDKASQSYEK